MLLTLNNENTVKLKKFTREFSGNQEGKIMLNLTVEAENISFEQLQGSFTPDAISFMTITDDENKEFVFESYELDNIIELHGDYGLNDIMIRLYKRTSTE